MRAQEHAHLRVLTSAAGTGFDDRARRGAGQQRQFEDLGGDVTELGELLARLGREVLFVEHPRHRQHDAERHAELDGLLRHETVGAVRQRGKHDDDAAGVLVAQAEQAVAHARPQDGNFVGNEVAMASDRDDEGTA